MTAGLSRENTTMSSKYDIRHDTCVTLSFRGIRETASSVALDGAAADSAATFESSPAVLSPTAAPSSSAGVAVLFSASTEMTVP